MRTYRNSISSLSLDDPLAIGNAVTEVIQAACHAVANSPHLMHKVENGWSPAIVLLPDFSQHGLDGVWVCTVMAKAGETTIDLTDTVLGVGVVDIFYQLPAATKKIAVVFDDEESGSLVIEEIYGKFTLTETYPFGYHVFKGDSRAEVMAKNNAFWASPDAPSMRNLTSDQLLKLP